MQTKCSWTETKKNDCCLRLLVSRTHPVSVDLFIKLPWSNDSFQWKQSEIYSGCSAYGSKDGSIRAQQGEIKAIWNFPYDYLKLHNWLERQLNSRRFFHSRVHVTEICPQTAILSLKRKKVTLSSKYKVLGFRQGWEWEEQNRFFRQKSYLKPDLKIHILTIAKENNLEWEHGKCVSWLK